MDSSYVSESIVTTLERFGGGPTSYGWVKTKKSGEIPLKIFYGHINIQNNLQQVTDQLIGHLKEERIH